MNTGAVVISGATGFLGGALARTLLAKGRPVVALGRDPAKLATLRALGARTARFELSSAARLDDSAGADAFVHCAALSAPWGRRHAFEAANVAGTANALDMASAAGIRRFVHISTPSVYFRFQDQRDLAEDSRLPTPVNTYAATKGRAEALVRGQANLETVILRPRGIYGAGDTALMPRLLRTAARRPLPLVRDGRAATDLTHVDDVVSAIERALIAPDAAGRTFNISGGEALNLRQVIDQAGLRAGVRVTWRAVPAAVLLGCARALEIMAQVRPGRPEPILTAYGAGLLSFTQTLDIRAAAETLGWRPVVGFEEGLERTFGAVR